MRCIACNTILSSEEELEMRFDGEPEDLCSRCAHEVHVINSDMLSPYNVPRTSVRSEEDFADVYGYGSDN